MSNRSHRWLRLTIVALMLAIATGGGLWIYVYYEAHRALSMIAEASRVRVGDSEASILPLVKRYGGCRWTTEPLPPRSQWSDSDEYDYEHGLVSDYEYNLEVSPFRVVTSACHVGGEADVARPVWTAVYYLPRRLRATLGIRIWDATIYLAIRNRHLQSASAVVQVEGRSTWLSFQWTFCHAMPRYEFRGKAFVVESGIIEGSLWGASIENIFTPEASGEQSQAARAFNAGCLTSMWSCEGLCDFAPRAIEYPRRHSDVPNNFVKLPVCH